MNKNLIGITEGADPTINLKWKEWVGAGKPAILITKMPRLLLPMLTGKENIIIHCTITGLGLTAFEPRIDSFTESFAAYDDLCSLFGPDRVVLRLDPIIMGMGFPHIPFLKSFVAAAKGRVRISFLDMYPHVEKRFLQHSILIKQESFHSNLLLRKAAWEELGMPEICGEPDMPSTPCVSALDCAILGVDPVEHEKGQRPYCHCLANKIELCKPPPKCTYGCLYCYWK
jgi:hypothetical protein